MLLHPSPALRFGLHTVGGAARVAATIVVLLLTGSQTLAQADISNGTVRLGVNTSGGLGIPPINVPLISAGGFGVLGLRYVPTNFDAASNAGGAAGITWGVGDTVSGNWGGYSTTGGPVSIAPVSFSSTASTAKVTVTAGAAGTFKVTHDFHPSTDPNLYEVTVTIQNVSAASVKARYRLGIDAVEPAPNNQYVTIQGAALPGVFEFTDYSGGGANGNPLVALGGASGDFVNMGPGDLGMGATLALGTLPPTGVLSFNAYYGACPDHTSALTAVTFLGLPGYSFLQPNNLPGTPNTFVMGFIPLAPAVAGVTIVESGGSTNVTEEGTTDTYAVVLKSLPMANVTITANPGAQVTVAPALLTFTPANWNVPQTVTVTAVDDAVVEGLHTGTITHTAASADPAYNGIAIANVVAHITDNDSTSSGSGEGSYSGFGFFGFGGRNVRTLAPSGVAILSRPTADGSLVRVRNISQRQLRPCIDPFADTDAGFGPLGWSLVLLLGGGVALAIKKSMQGMPA